jgi:hypothetical protein
VGSSRSITAGSWTTAQARLVRRTIPPDSSPDTVLGPVSERHERQRPVDGGLAVFDPVQPGEEVDVPPDGQLAVDGLVLRHVAQSPTVPRVERDRAGPVDPYLPVAGPEQPQETADQRRLAGAVRPGHPDDLGAVDVEVDAVQRGHRAELPAQVPDVDRHGVAHRARSPSWPPAAPTSVDMRPDTDRIVQI